MSDEEIRVAVAEACGWYWNRDTVYSPSGSRTARVNLVGYEASLEEHLPDYPNDLNAMHEAEEKLSLAQRYLYCGWLDSITEKGRMTPLAWLTTTASARQRAEAFLRTLGEWKEDVK